MSLNVDTLSAALEVPANGQSISRAIIDGTVLIYDLDDVPDWAQVILDARDEDGIIEQKYAGTPGVPYTEILSVEGAA